MFRSNNFAFLVMCMELFIKRYQKSKHNFGWARLGLHGHVTIWVKPTEVQSSFNYTLIGSEISLESNVRVFAPSIFVTSFIFDIFPVNYIHAYFISHISQSNYYIILIFCKQIKEKMQLKHLFCMTVIKFAQTCSALCWILQEMARLFGEFRGVEKSGTWNIRRCLNQIGLISIFCFYLKHHMTFFCQSYLHN